MEKMSKFNTRQKSEKNYDVHKIGGAHLQCVNNHYVKYEYKGMNTVGVKITQTMHPLSILDEKIV